MKKVVLYIIGGITAVAVIVLAVMSISSNSGEATPSPSPSAPVVVVIPGGPTDEPTPGAEPGSGSGGAEDPTQEPTIEAEEPEEPEPVDLSDGLADGEHSKEHTALDISVVREQAVQVVTELSTFDTDEPQADREKRIAAVAGADSPVITQGTALARSQHSRSVDWSARSGIVNRPYAGFRSENGSAITFGVVADYWGSYGTPEKDSQQARGNWLVTIEYALDDKGVARGVKVLLVKEPTFVLQ